MTYQTKEELAEAIGATLAGLTLILIQALAVAWLVHDFVPLSFVDIIQGVFAAAITATAIRTGLEYL